MKSGAGAREPAQKTPTGSGVQRSRIKRGEGREQKTQDRGRRHGLWVGGVVRILRKAELDSVRGQRAARTRLLLGCGSHSEVNLLVLSQAQGGVPSLPKAHGATSISDTLQSETNPFVNKV